MSKCPTVHERPEFSESYNSSIKEQLKLKERITRFLSSDAGNMIGEKLKYEFVPFKSFPPGRSRVKCLFLLCKDCRGEVLRERCGFCNSSIHSKDDAVLFLMLPEEELYYKQGRLLIEKIKK